MIIVKKFQALCKIEKPNSIEKGGVLLTSILTGDEIDPIAELDLQASVAHEILQPDFLDDSGFGTVAAAGDWLGHGWV